MRQQSNQIHTATIKENSEPFLQYSVLYEHSTRKAVLTFGFYSIMIQLSK